MTDISFTNTPSNSTKVELLTRQWFEQVVLGLNLCPFAHQPSRQNTIRFKVCEHIDEETLIKCVIDEIGLLEKTDISQCETTLIIIPNLLTDFYDYQFFLSETNRLLKRHQWQGVFQLASFHPNYCFAGSDVDDSSNLTNRSPYPIIHILREDSLTQAVEKFPNTENIPQENIETMKKLDQNQKAQLFPYLNLCKE